MKKRSREPKPLHPILASAAGPALIKYLASCNPRVRSQSLQLIQSWLVAEPELLSEPDIGKLWKGLFYCLWHSDKTQNQVALINRLTSLFLSLQPPLSLEFFRGFLITLRREWPGIDRLRLDKFYLFIRRFFRVLFEMFKSRGWGVDLVDEYFGVLDKNGFMADDKLRGNGVNYHVVSVFLEELKSVGFPLKREVIHAIFKPFFSAILKSEDKVLVSKMKSCLFDELLKMGRDLLTKKKTGVSCDAKDGDALLGIVALTMGFSEKLYEVGSGIDCIQGNRKLILGLHEEFQKLETESSGIEISISEYNTTDAPGDIDEVPQLIPIECHDSKANGGIQTETDEACDNNHYYDGCNKKRKKARKDVKGQDKKKKGIRKHEKAVSETSSLPEKNGDLVSSGVDAASDGIALNETIILNLQKQFEKVVSDSDFKSDENSGSTNTHLSSMKRGKRRRVDTANKNESGDQETLQIKEDRVNGSEKSVEKSVKKVHFGMKHNLVWKPQTPLPPENLRLPPSVTPRGSALKKGVPPGPILEMLPTRIKSKKKKKKKTAQSRVGKTVTMLQ